MKNTVKVALAFVAGGALLLLNQKRRKKKQETKNFIAPDGNTYQENQIYRTIEGKLYKNGKPLHFDTPNPERNSQSMTHHDENRSNNYETKPKNVEYHQRGDRHR